MLEDALAWVPCEEIIETGYGVMVGGGLSSAPHLAQILPFFIRPEQVWPVVKAISELFRDEGYRLKRNRARFKFLVADWGVERIAQEVQARLDFPLDSHTDFPELEDQETDHLGIHAQKQPGLFWVGVNFPGGRIRGGKLEVIADLAAKYSAPGLDSIRLTNKQNDRPGRSARSHERLVQGQNTHPLLRLPLELRPAPDRRHRIRGARTKINGEMVDAYDARSPTVGLHRSKRIRSPRTRKSPSRARR